MRNEKVTNLRALPRNFECVDNFNSVKSLPTYRSYNYLSLIPKVDFAKHIYLGTEEPEELLIEQFADIGLRLLPQKWDKVKVLLLTFRC
jgi:hypothetical protein